MHGITRKYLDRRDWKRLLKSRLWMTEGYEERFSGYAALIEVQHVRAPLDCAMETGTIRIVDDGYTWFQWMPLDMNWAASAMLNDRAEIVEWYFDITAQNGLEDGRAYYDDLLLDVVVLPDGTMVLLDEDELLEAQRGGLVTREQAEMAYSVARDIMENVAADVDALAKWTHESIAWMRANTMAKERQT